MRVGQASLPVPVHATVDHHPRGQAETPVPPAFDDTLVAVPVAMADLGGEDGRLLWKGLVVF
jgi:hypothetical protein